MTTPASDKQIAFVRSLIGDLADLRQAAEGTAFDRAKFEAIGEAKITAGMDRVAASAAIDTMLAKIKAIRAANPEVHGVAVRSEYAEVEAGRYAVDNEDGVLRFYRVDRPTEGRWAGYTFVKVYASDTTYPVKGEAKKAVLAKIAVDPKAAMLRFGQEIGKCGHCGRTLTDETSRAFGIGPVCREGLGW